MRILNTVFASTALLVVAGCGGGGGGGSSTPTPTPTPTPTHNAPSITTAATASVLEGSTTSWTLAATDADGDTVSFSISGTDSADFTLDGATLSFAATPDYETPLDSDGDNVYALVVTASDGSASDTLALSITVTDASEGRVIDGPVSGAAVFIDLDGDSVQDDDESSGTTDADGYFKIPVATAIDGTAPKLISIGGTDTSTGSEVADLALISDMPSDATKSLAVTPLSTIVSAAETAEAKAKVLTALGITGEVEDVLTKDVWKEAQEGDADAKAIQNRAK